MTARKNNVAKAASTAQLAAAFGFITKAAGEEFIRDDSPDGAHHSIRVALTCQVDGAAPIYREWEGTTDTGHSSVRASSVGAKPGEVLAYVTSKLNAATREALYRELAEVFAASGGRLPVEEAAVEAADEALGRLRQKVEQPVRGTFRVSANRVDTAADAAPPEAPAKAAPKAAPKAAESPTAKRGARKADK